MPFPSLSRMSVTTTSGLAATIAATAASSSSAKPMTSKPPRAWRFSIIRLRISGEPSTIKTRKDGLIGYAGALAHEAVFERVRCEIRISRAVHLLQNAGAIGTYGLDRQVHLVGDLRHRLAAGKLDEDLKLPVGELAMRRLRRLAGGLERKGLGKRPADVLATGQDQAQGLQQILRFPGLGKKSARASAQQIDGVLLLRVHADDQNRQIRPPSLEQSDGLDDRGVRKGDVEHHHVEFPAGRQLER